MVRLLLACLADAEAAVDSHHFVDPCSLAQALDLTGRGAADLCGKFSSQKAQKALLEVQLSPKTAPAPRHVHSACGLKGLAREAREPGAVKR